MRRVEWLVCGALAGGRMEAGRRGCGGKAGTVPGQPRRLTSPPLTSFMTASRSLPAEIRHDDDEKYAVDRSFAAHRSCRI